MQVSEKDLKEFILDSGLVPRKDLEAADAEAQKRKQSVGDILVGQGALTADALRRIKAYVLGIPFINLKDRKVPLEILSLIPEPIARTRITSSAFAKKTASWRWRCLIRKTCLLSIPYERRRGSRYCRALPTKSQSSMRFCSIRNH
jgi:hypothetical protein